MKLIRLGFANYRSIGCDPVVLDIQQRLNLLIGANNSGKSNVLQILRRLKHEQLHQISLGEIDFHRREGTRNLELLLDVERTDGAELPKEQGRFHAVVANGVRNWITTPFDELDYRQFNPFMQKWTGEHWT